MAELTSSVNSRAVVVRFGEFEVDFRRGELRHNHVIVPIQEKPLALLIALVEEPGHVVTREQLYQRLWPDQTFVGFEDGLNTAIRKLRHTLSDSADSPRFIETVPRRGYRFIATIHEIATPPGPIVRPDIARESVKVVAGEGRTSLVTCPETAVSPDVGSRRRQWLVIAVTAAVLACATLFFSIRPNLAPPEILNVTQLTHDGRFKTRLVTDGTRIYFNTYVSTGTKISQVSVGGGEVTEVPSTRELVLHTPELGLLDVAADGTDLLLGLDSMSVGELPLSLLPLPSGTAARVGNVLATDGALSPQGDRIAYFHAQELWIVQRDGTNLRKIAHVPGDPAQIRWSPDGLRLRFGMNCSIWEVQPDGKGLHELFIGWNHPSPECSTAGDWTRDGKYYVFSSRRGGIRNLWLARDTKDLWHKVDQTPQQFTAGTMQMYGVVPSRDGNRLFAVGGTPRTEVVCFDQHTRQFVGCLFDLSATELNFSRDGRWLAYVDSVDSTLWRSKADGTERLQLSPAGMHIMGPQFSPNGKQIAFAGSRPDAHFQIYLISVDGGDFEQLTNGENDERWLSWSPAGDTIVFGHYDEINADHQNLIQLLYLPTRRISSLVGSQKLSFPQWSPDGRHIAAISVTDFKLYILDPKSGTSTQLGDMSVDRAYWSPDSRYVYFNSFFAGEPAICRVSVSTHKVERVASLAGVKRTPWSWAGLASDGRLLAVRSLSNYEIYAIDWQAP